MLKLMQQNQRRLVVNQRPECLCVCVCVCVLEEILGNRSLWLSKALLEPSLLKISVHITGHLFKVSELASLPQEVTFEDIKDLTSWGQHV